MGKTRNSDLKSEKSAAFSRSSTELEEISLCHASANNSRIIEQRPQRLMTEVYEPMHTYMTVKE